MAIELAQRDSASVRCATCEGDDQVMALRFPWPGDRRNASVVNLCASCRTRTADVLMSDDQDEAIRRHLLLWRGIEAGDQCRTCHGDGRRCYASTATWRGGMGGASVTWDVCDACWGSGDRTRPGANLRQLRDEEGQRVAAAAVGALAQACGATLRTAAPQVMEIVRILRDEVAKADRGRSRKPGATARDSIWFAPLAKGLADMLERATRAR